MFALISGNMADGSKNVCAVRSGALDTVSVVYPALSGFMIDVEVLEVVVEVDRARAQIPAEQGSVRGEDRRHVNVPLPAPENSRQHEEAGRRETHRGMASPASHSWK